MVLAAKSIFFDKTFRQTEMHAAFFCTTTTGMTAMITG
jgi:hypothetical protein